MKKIGTLMICAALILSFSACGSPKGDVNQTTRSGSQVVGNAAETTTAAGVGTALTTKNGQITAGSTNNIVANGKIQTANTAGLTKGVNSTKSSQVTPVKYEASDINASNGGLMTVLSGSLYGFDTTGIVKMTLNGESKKYLNKDKAACIASGGGYLFYAVTVDPEAELNKEKSDVYRMKPDGSGKTKILSANHVVSMLQYANGYLYYALGAFAGGKIYKMKPDGSGNTCIYKDNIDTFTVYKGYVYFSNWNKTPTSRMKTDGSDIKVIYSKGASSRIHIVNDKLYFTRHASGLSICSSNLDGTGVQELIPVCEGKFIVLKDTIYFCNSNDKCALYGYNTKTKQNKRITQMPPINYQVAGDNLYIQFGKRAYKDSEIHYKEDNPPKDGIYLVNPNGSEPTLILEKVY